MLIGRSLNADVDLVFAGDWDRLVVADVAVKSYSFRLVAVYASFFQRLEPFLGNSKRIVLEDNWNTILGPKIDKARRDASGLNWWESSLVDFMAHFDLVDRFRLGHQGRKMWTWIDSSPSVLIRSYLDSVS